MTAVNKMRIICDPYAKVIDYKWFDAAEGEFVRIEEYSSELVSEKYVNATIQKTITVICAVLSSCIMPTATSSARRTKSFSMAQIM